jgi:hypothetical protein
VSALGEGPPECSPSRPLTQAELISFRNRIDPVGHPSPLRPELAVLVSKALPKQIETFGFLDAIWVTDSLLWCRLKLLFASR